MHEAAYHTKYGFILFIPPPPGFHEGIQWAISVVEFYRTLDEVMMAYYVL